MRQDLERVTDAAERHLRPRQRQDRSTLARLAIVSLRAPRPAPPPRVARSSFDSGGAKSGFSSSDIVSGCWTISKRAITSTDHSHHDT